MAQNDLTYVEARVVRKGDRRGGHVIKVRSDSKLLRRGSAKKVGEWTAKETTEKAVEKPSDEKPVTRTRRGGAKAAKEQTEGVKASEKHDVEDDAIVAPGDDDDF